MSESSEGKPQSASGKKESAIDLAVFSRKISQVVTPMGNDVALPDLYVLSSKGKNFGTRMLEEAMSNPPDAWRSFIDNISPQEKSILIPAIGVLLSVGIRNLGELRKIDVEDLAAMRSEKRRVGTKTANFVKNSLGASQTVGF